MNKPRVLVAFDSMKTGNSGYYYFGTGLGEAIIKENNNRFNLTFYLHKRVSYKFKTVGLLWLSKIHKLFFRHRNKFDLVHFSDQDARLKANKVNAKKIVTIHDMNKMHLNATPENIVSYLKRIGTLISRTDRVVAISQFVANDIRKYFPEAESKLSVIYNGADKLIPEPGHAPSLKPEGEFLFAIGILSFQKGFHLLPALLAGNNYQLIIAGRETPHKQIIIREAIKYNCLDRVHMTGPVSDADKAWYYENCSAFLFPSRTEGFGLPVIEAMYFGKPCFLSNLTSLPEIGGDVAYYFDQLEPEDMQKVFRAGMEDYNARQPLEAIISQANKFSWAKAAKEYLMLYEECLSGQRRNSDWPS